MPKLIRITTAPLSLDVLLRGQMRYMSQNGFDVLMVSSDGKELEKVKQYEGCRHEIVPMTRKITPLVDLRTLWLMYKLFRRESPDIVHSHTPKGGLIAMLAARLAGVKIRIHTVAGLRFMTTKGTGRRILIAMEKLTGSAATHVWPNSFSLLHYIQENKLVSLSKLDIIGKGSSNGIDLTRYSRAALDRSKLDAIKHSIGYDDRLLYFLSVGRIVNDKGIDELVHAFINIHKMNERARLVMVGAFEDEVDPVSDETKNLLRTHPGVVLAGWSDSVEYYMALAFALVHPSHREGFPNVLLQAGAMLCPIICSRIEGNVDIVDHEKTGLLFTVKDREELEQRMVQAIAEPADLEGFARDLRTKIELHFDQPVVHKHLRERYLQLLVK
ncbi:MAG: glycosyltransferase family 4 protein [Chitinophagaceae bacterium]|nr:glycosyltransferase family 4 protein [Chitinophagaceae bacterium]